MKVFSVVNDAYELLDLVSRRVATVHVSRLHPFKYDATIDPENVAIRDRGEFVVQDIVDALIDPLLPQWSFKVRSAGYDESFDEWLDWNELKSVDKLHDFLRKNNLGRHIPRSCQQLQDKPLKRKRKMDKEEITKEPEQTNMKVRHRNKKRKVRRT